VGSTTHVTIDQWQAVGIVCGSLIALITVVGLLRRKVIVPMLETFRQVSTLVRQLVGDKDSTPRRPSLMELVTDVRAEMEQQALKLAQVERAQAEHLAWHAHPGRQPATAPGRPNGQRGR
jgi:hypothetical protein